MAYSKQNFQDGQILTAANLEKMENGIIAGQGAYNLLDNSDFRIAQAGYGGMHGTQKYACDRWYDTYGFGSFSFDESQGLTIAYGTNHAYLVQKINDASQYHNKTMTVALQLSDGTIYVNSGTYLSSGISFRISASNWLCDLHPDRIELVVTSGSVTIKWAALYKGSYTADTLPPYVPKDKYIEMLNCGVPTSPRNILKNSDFIHPLNTTGFTSKSSGAGTVIDGWASWIAGNGGNIELTSSGIKLSPPSRENIGIYQNIENYELNRIHTIVVYINDTPYIKTFQMGNFGVGTAFGPIDFFSIPTANVLLRISSTHSAVTIQKVALYEGAYTIDTLPGYISNTKHVEMLNCNVPLAPHNLLDNSDFTNPVNQRGQTTYTGSCWTIDRWRTWNNDATITLTSEGIKGDGTDASVLYQGIELHKIKLGTSYTVAVGYSDGTISCGAGTLTTSDSVGIWNNEAQACLLWSDGSPFIRLWHATKTIQWVVIYPGSYDASTLPAYQPKGYTAELAECQRYYRTMVYPVIPCANNPAGTQVYGFLPFRMRIDNPTIACDTLYYFKGDTTFYTVSSASAGSYGAGTRIVFNLSSNVEGNLAGAIAGNGITLNADL